MASTKKRIEPTSEPVQTAEPEAEPVDVNVDVVAMVSRRADGTPDQTDGFQVIDTTDLDA